jgi:hypothetical protein
MMMRLKESREPPAAWQVSARRRARHFPCPSIMRYTSTGRWMFFNLTLPMLSYH